MPSDVERLARVYSNYIRLLLLVTETIANPTGTNIDAVVTAATTNNLAQPQVTHTVDGESYDWNGYQTMITSQLAAIRAQMVAASGPWEIRTIGRV